MEALIPESIDVQLFESANVFPPAYSSPYEDEHCYVDRVAYDIGSHTTKFMAATVNVCKMTVEKIFSQDSYTVRFQQDLLESLDNSFSELIQEFGVKALKSAKTQAEIEFYLSRYQPKRELEHCAVATAAFRDANNGESYVQFLKHALDIPINLISQEEEGQLAYYGAVALLGNSTKPPIVWDIGGGSMQLTYKDDRGDFHILGGELAANTFQSLVLEQIVQKDLSSSPHPMNTFEVNEAIKLAKEYLIFSEETKNFLKQKIIHDTPVIAVGSVHNYGVQPLCKLITKGQGKQYTKNNLHQAINLLTDQTDAEILQLLPDSNEQFVKTQLTNLILVYAMMDLMGINEVHTLSSSNVQGLLLKGC